MNRSKKSLHPKTGCIPQNFFIMTKITHFCLGLVWILSFFFISLSGQNAPDMSIEEQLLNAFTELDTAEITTGILYERVPEYVPLRYLDGKQLPDSIAMDSKSFAMAYGMINWAHFDNYRLAH